MNAIEMSAQEVSFYLKTSYFTSCKYKDGFFNEKLAFGGSVEV